MSRARRYAFFDLDGTLIADTSMVSFHRFQLERTDPAGAEQRWQQFLHTAAELRKAGVAREQQNTLYYRQYLAGMRIDHLAELAQQWLEVRRRDPQFWRQALLLQLQRHREQGVEPVLVTGSFREIAQCVGRELGVSQWLSAPLEERAGHYTGELTAPPSIGAGKVRAIRAFVQDAPEVLESSFGYGDDESDVPFLDLLGFPHALSSGTPGLLAYAAEHAWPVISIQLPDEVSRGDRS